MATSNELLSGTAAITSVDGPRKSSRVVPTLSYFAAFIGLGLTTGLLGPTLPSLAQQTGVSLAAISYLFTVRSLGYIAGSMRLGPCFDTGRGNRLLGVLLVVMSLSCVVVTQIGRLWELLLVMFLLGAAEGALDVGANVLMVRLHGRRVGPYMNAMHSFFGAGAFVAPLIVAWVSSAAYRAVQSYLFVAVLLLPATLNAFRVSEKQPAGDWNGKKESPGRNRLTQYFALFLLLYVGAEVGFGGWIFTYVLAANPGTSTTAAYVTSLFWGALTAGRILTIPLTTRVMPTRLLLISLATALINLSLLVFASGLVTISIATVGFGLSMASIFPSTLTLASEKMRGTGRLTGWFVTGGSLGAMVVPVAIGQLLQLFGPQALIVGTASTLVLALIVLKSMTGIRLEESS
jgi:FHS family Na+ dependent glucose MFS transporter 1